MKMIVPDYNIYRRMQFDPAYLCAAEIPLIIDMVNMVVLDYRKDAAEIADDTRLPSIMYIADYEDVRADLFPVPSFRRSDQRTVSLRLCPVLVLV